MEGHKEVDAAIRAAWRVGIGFHLCGTSVVPIAKVVSEHPSDVQQAFLDRLTSIPVAASRIAEVLNSDVVPGALHEDGPDCWCSPELSVECSRCDGKGVYRRRACRDCGGRGRILVNSLDKADRIRHRSIPGREV